MKPGDKVVCVDDNFPDWVNKLYTSLPKGGVQYVIRATSNGVAHEAGRKPSLVVWLLGVSNPVSEASGQEYGFQPRRFRLLDELKQEARQRNHQPVMSSFIPGFKDFLKTKL